MIVPVFLIEATATDLVILKKNLASELSEVAIPKVPIARTEIKTAFNVELFKVIGELTNLKGKEDKTIYNSAL